MTIEKKAFGSLIWLKFVSNYWTRDDVSKRTIYC